MKPNAKLYGGGWTYAYFLDLVELTELPHNVIARHLGVDKRTFRYWLSGTYKPANTYAVMYMLEQLVEPGKMPEDLP